MQLKSGEVEEGYTMDAVVSRQVLKLFCLRVWVSFFSSSNFFLLYFDLQNLLMEVRDKLLFEPEYAGNVKDKIPPKSSLRIPWPWLPAALSLLQEV